VETLLNAGASVEGARWRRRIWRQEPTPLLAAIRSGEREIVEALLNRGADPNHDTKAWMTPLALACKEGNRAIVELLVSRGADARQGRVEHGTPIEQAAWYGHEELVILLLGHGADPDSVLSNGLGSLVRVRPSILRRLIAAGGHASPEVAALVEQDESRR
jgi:ankyrin repeat protein